MPVDTSMYGMIKPVDVMGSVEGGLRMRDLLDQRKLKQQEMQKQEQLDSVYNEKLAMSGSQFAGLGQKGYAEQNDMRAKEIQAAVQKAQFGAQLLGAARDQDSWMKARNELAGYGIPVENISDQFSPQEQQRLVDQAMTLGDRLQQQRWQSGHDLEKDKFGQQKKDKQRELDILEGKTKAEKTGKIGELATNLRKERSDLPVTRDTQKVSASYNRIQKAAGNASAAGDLALIFNYMKMLDPGSTVREGEFANAQNAAGVPDQVMNMYNRIRSGQRLNPAQRQDFIKQAGGQYQAQLDLQNQADQTFIQLAQQSGIDPSQVIVNFQASSPKEKKKIQQDINAMGDADIDALYSQLGGQ